MFKKLLGLILIFHFSPELSAQYNSDSARLIYLNQQVDDLVVNQDLVGLDTIYAKDFVFSLGTGKVEGKESWMATVRTTKYVLRHNDSVKAELHADFAFLKGNLRVQRNDGFQLARYHLKYIRIYALRNRRWQLVSHLTTGEWHDK